MTEHQDRLREAFNKYENDTPDPAAVFARVEELARKHTWRRRGVQAAGGVALSAGLIAGVTQLQAILPAGPAVTSNAPALQPAAAATPSAAPTIDPSATLTEEQMAQGFDAYFAAGFGYDNAVELAELWNLGRDKFAQAKAVGGLKLLNGETLPVTPIPNSDGPAPGEPSDADMEKNLEAFFAVGYGWDDAEKLAELWNLPGPFEAKVKAGRKLLAGEELPIPKPSEGGSSADREAAAVRLFFAAGYDYDDAVKLAELWKLGTAYDAKVAGGERLADGEKLPIEP